MLFFTHITAICRSLEAPRRSPKASAANKRARVQSSKGKAAVRGASKHLNWSISDPPILTVSLYFTGGAIEITGNRKVTLLWRKYGQKNLRGKPWKGIVRCYYKCYNSSCPARKLVEKHASDLDKIIETKFENEHNHTVAAEDMEESGVYARKGGDDGDASDDTLEI